MQFNKRLRQAGDSYFETKIYVKIYKKNVNRPNYPNSDVWHQSDLWFVCRLNLCVYFVNESFVFLSVVQDDVLTDWNSLTETLLTLICACCVDPGVAPAVAHVRLEFG